MDGLSAIGPATGQTPGTLGNEWSAVFWAIPLTRHSGSVEQSNSQVRPLAGPEVQVPCLTDAKETQVLQILKGKGAN